ncbi:MAG: endonuclease V [Methanobacteriota archaeon]|nr:MAG: endonuclease V [Euryarchaeota archaeon]
MMLHESLKDLPDLWAEAQEIVRQVPRGRVTTYGRVAEALGDRASSKFVWLALTPSERAEDVPWHRVVRSDGSLVGSRSSDTLAEKATLLSGEGVAVTSGKIADFRDLLYDDLKSSSPLSALRAKQMRLRERVKVPRSDVRLSRVAGVDVSYDGNRAFASLVTLDFESEELLDERSRSSEVRFPYIPSYLAFRELPLVAPLVSSLDEETVLMYDGNGILHPHGFGVACHAGIVFDVPTIGVAKRLLCGTLSGGQNANVSKVLNHGEMVGYAVAHGEHKPIYISPGHGISRSQSLFIVRRFLKSRIPIPLQMAHERANALRRSADD